MERDVFALNQIDLYVSSSPTPVFVRMADTVEERTLHMENSDRGRTPSFTAFGDPNYFVTDAGPSCGSNPCVDYHFAWSHGDIQPEIATTWMGIVGPGVQRGGIDSNAPFGQFAMNTLVASTAAIKSTNEETYGFIEDKIASLTSERNELVAHIRSALNAAAFDDQPLNEQQAKDWIAQARDLLNQAQALASSS